MGLFSSEPIHPTTEERIISNLVWQVIELYEPERGVRDKEVLKEQAIKASDAIDECFGLGVNFLEQPMQNSRLLIMALGHEYEESGMTLPDYLVDEWSKSSYHS